ncbi:MAG: nucleotide exchange factor GrpE [Lachnospiraceae bacterium]|nr:nucleotide exchange factor GrpE [Lachnospiraceae bacterium]
MEEKDLNQVTDEEVNEEALENAEAVANDEASEGNDDASAINEESEDSSQDSKKEKKEKKEKKDKKDEKIEELQDRYIRTMAEFENFRKRNEREKATMFDMGAKAVIEKLLPIMDNFERGLKAISEADKENPYAQGMEKIYQQFSTTFKEIGIETMETVGEQFDPNVHNAVMHVEDEAYGENEIVEEFQKGYKYHDSVVRCPMVKVAN